MSAERILALAQILHAVRDQEETTQDELLQELNACSTVDQWAKACHLVDPERRIWRLTWDDVHVDVKEVPALDVQEPHQRNRVRPVEEMLDF